MTHNFFILTAENSKVKEVCDTEGFGHFNQLLLTEQEICMVESRSIFSRTDRLSSINKMVIMANNNNLIRKNVTGLY